MVELRETQQIVNDNNRHVFGKSPTGKPPRYEFYKTSSANIKPGAMVILVAGATGDYTCTECGAGTNLGYGIAEWDEKQVADCTIAYAQGDLIPIIPFEGNNGTILRNIFITDPNAAINPNTGFVAGAVGALAVDAGIDTVYMRSKYFVADADNPTRLVAYIAKSINFADS